MQVNRIFVASAARLTRTKLSLAATFVIIALFLTSTPVFADTLVAGSVYFDSEQTLKEVITLSEQHDNEGIAKLIKNGHVSDRTREEKDIVVLTSGSTPESPAEFRFLNGPTTYWTVTKNVTNFAKPIATPTPLPTPTRTNANLRNLRHHPLNSIIGKMKTMLLLMTKTVTVFGIRSMANGNGILLINVTYLQRKHRLRTRHRSLNHDS